MAKTYVYLLGGDLDALDMTDRKQIVKMGLNLEGYCDLGWAEGYAIYGTLPKLKKFVEDYIGVDIVDDYLFEEDVFEDISSDADWKDVNFQSWELLNTFKKGFGESKKVSRKSIKESRETFKFNFPNNKEVISFLKPMEYGLTSAQLMTNTSGNWAKIEDPIFEESGYMYIENKQSNSYIQYDFAKVVNSDIDWGNHQIYFYTKGDVLMLHFYNLSDEEFNFLIYGDEHLDGLATRFGK